MPISNTIHSFGSVTRGLHWLTALLILTAIPLGVIANRLPYDTSEALAQKAALFSLHKTLGIAAFVVAALRIFWALGQRHPAGLHPKRRLESGVAALVHWVLYVSMLAVPLSGWVHHAATEGFAPILWPFGQGLPLVAKSESVAGYAGAVHWVFTKLLIGSVLLHIAGALKHHFIDRDATLRRMLWGAVAGEARPARRFARWLAPVGAVAIYGAGAALAFALSQQAGELASRPAQVPANGQAALTEPLAAGGNWQVEDGRLAIGVRQLGSDVAGEFAGWSAVISFDETVKAGAAGRVEVAIDTASLTLGSVSQQAKGPEFLNAEVQPGATFAAAIDRTPEGYVATGTLTLRGVAVPVSLPFTLSLEGEIARIEGRTTLDRRDFGMGAKYGDEATVGFGVEVTVSLTARRKG